MKCYQLEWKRARRNSVGAHVWPSRCGRYLVAAYDWCMGVKLSPVIYTAWAHGRKISTHRTRGAAARACNRHARARNATLSTTKHKGTKV